MFDDFLRLNEYPEGIIDQMKHSQNHQKDPRPVNTEWSYLKIPCIPERLNYRITDIFRKEGIPVRVAHKSYTLRQALSHNNKKERTCTRANCPISSTKLCSLRNAVYQITCSNCNQHIRSITRFIDDLVKEHLKNDNSCVTNIIFTVV